jgi:Flp pilus assembly protein TadD
MKRLLTVLAMTMLATNVTGCQGRPSPMEMATTKALKDCKAKGGTSAALEKTIPATASKDVGVAIFACLPRRGRGDYYIVIPVPAR